MPGVAPRQVCAHAKVNLALAVGPPIPEGQPKAGFHPIASWMHAIDLHDTVEITPAATTAHDIAWADGSPVDWDVASDLCVRAHKAVEALLGRELPAMIRVRKSIPAGGGLGGGSADAAAVLLGLRDAFAIDLNDDRLTGVARTLGSDIPFFMDTQAWNEGRPPRPALVTGLGEGIRRLDRQSQQLTLWCPSFGCATGAVYRAFDEAPTETCDTERVGRLAEAATIDDAELFNDLAGPAERVEPRLVPCRSAIEDFAGRPAHVSGSGSTMFTLGRVMPRGDMPDDRAGGEPPMDARAVPARLV